MQIYLHDRPTASAQSVDNTHWLRITDGASTISIFVSNPSKLEALATLFNIVVKGPQE